MYGSLDISVSGMVAQRQRLEVAAANIANSSTILDAQGNPEAFGRRFAVLRPGDPSAAGKGRQWGVHVGQVAVDTESEPRKVLDPGSPWAKPAGHPDEGYVYFPNIDTVVEQVNALEAQRAYEANAAVAETTRQMAQQALRLIA
ncbi:MAG: flagellar basal body rod protein FlgC [Phycisphaerales bacterium]|nr:flagellar basal body rod protein FlgC [Phycisphaerales bacterium]